MIKFYICVFAVCLYLYWLHRAFHASTTLYKFHEYHHREFKYAFHPVEWAFNFIPTVSFVWWMVGWKFTAIATIWTVIESLRGHGQLLWIPVPKIWYVFLWYIGIRYPGPKYHKRHHIEENCNYAQFTRWPDQWFGTQKLKDDPKLTLVQGQQI